MLTVHSESTRKLTMWLDSKSKVVPFLLGAFSAVDIGRSPPSKGRWFKSDIWRLSHGPEPLHVRKRIEYIFRFATLIVDKIVESQGGTENIVSVETAGEYA